MFEKDKTNWLVKEISKKEAKELIMRYEWLDTFGSRVLHCLGLYINGELAGAVSFARVPTMNSADGICGREYRDKVIFLQRGAISPNFPNNCSSFLISNACKLIGEKGYNIIYAYADERAGEIGTVYQACNWIYTGKTKQHAEFFIGGKWRHGKGARDYCKKHNLPHPSVNRDKWRNGGQKHRYITFVGENKNVRKNIKFLLRYKVLSYPKRKEDNPKHIIAKLKREMAENEWKKTQD